MDKKLIKRGHEKFEHPVLSDLMCRVLIYVKWWMEEKGYPPTFSEVEGGIEIPKNTVQHCVEALVKYGYLFWVHPRGRGFDVTYEGRIFTDPRVSNKRNSEHKHQQLNDSAYEIMVTINRLTQKNRIPPTQAEIMRELDLNSTSIVQQHVKSLRVKGYLFDNSDLPKGKRVIIQTAKGLRLGVGNETVA